MSSVKKLTCEGELFCPLTAAKYCVAENGDSVEEILNDILTMIEPNVWNLIFEDDAFTYDEEPKSSWYKSMRNAIKFTADKEYTLFPYSVEKSNETTYWKYNFNGRDIIIDSYNNIDYPQV